MLLAYCVGVSSEEIMFKHKCSRLELSLRREQFMLRETCAWVADGQIPSGAHQGANKSVFGEPRAFLLIPQSFPICGRVTPISFSSSIWNWQVGIFLQWAMGSGPEVDINFWPHNKNSAIFKTKSCFRSVRTPSTYDVFVSHHPEGLEGPTTSAFSVGAVLGILPFPNHPCMVPLLPSAVTFKSLFCFCSKNPGFVPFVLLLSRSIFTANRACTFFPLPKVFTGNQVESSYCLWHLPICAVEQHTVRAAGASTAWSQYPGHRQDS